MNDKNGSATDGTVDHDEHDGWSTRTKLILGGIGVIGFILLYLLAVYWVPGEWTRFITGITNQSTSTSWLLGLAIGFSFSLLPILVFLMGMRMRKTWRGIIGWFVVALVVALPNILTLGVRFGTRPAAKAARTTMFTDAPGFTLASYIGMAIGIATGLWVAWVTVSRRRAKRKADQLAAKTREHEQTAASSQESSAGDDRASASTGDSGSSDSDSSVSSGSDSSDAADDQPATGDHGGSVNSSSDDSESAGSGE